MLKETMLIVFIDPKCPTPYDSEVLRTRSLGGTEASVIRVALGLSARHTVKVLQHNRTEPRVENENLEFLPISALDTAVRGADHVVFIQKAQYIDTVVRAGSARLWLWLHNFLKDEVPFFWQDHLRYKLGIVCVSQTHAAHTLRHMRSLVGYWATAGLMGRGGLLYQHNPIDEVLAPDPLVLRDPFKLVFFSSPYKGIEHVVSAFREAHLREPRLRLYIADPGYIKKCDPTLLDTPGITTLGSLPQREVLKHVREALCVFYPQRKRPETFGLVYAEANAVGTPVLAHDFGAAAEILSKRNPPMDTSQTAVVETLLDWVRNGGPSVQANPLFGTQFVVDRWLQFFAAPDRFIREQNLGS
ncbi:glycosyltransferase [Rhodoferax sp.]|uniref:glycosyltransferase n=1 Tax=Rhodoferax sp. TaxID=50421 RepID=UPI0025FE2110|nr:glycosyltransferase [Rhodoferax sp.]